MNRSPETYQRMYFIGIGGIGMSALARYFMQNKKSVAGFDRTPGEITLELEEAGAQIHYEASVSNIPEAFRSKEDTLVIYTPAIRADHVELRYFREHGFDIQKRAVVLGAVTRNSVCLAVTGTHGKTTTSGILAHLMKETEMPFTAFLGGISVNLNNNYVHTGTKYTVVEADEFDRSFLQLHPDIACVTSMDADHLDIYGDKYQLEKAFRDFAARIGNDGKLLVRSGLPLKGMTFGFDKNDDYSISDIKISDSTYLFTMGTPYGEIHEVSFGMPGRHNLLNALAALAMAAESGAPLGRLAKALSTFKGMKRRFTTHHRSDEVVYIDDYAHHPAEIDAVAEAVRSFYPGRRTRVIFQPHLFSRTKDFADEFARSLAQFDEILLLEIYPAREEPIPGVTSAWLAEKIRDTPVQVISKEELAEKAKSDKATVYLSLGAGDIGRETETIKMAVTA
ncbi:UDP-N-acetylmuramate--L-alanine ligase [Robertkochia aurantiaca]|uniref:UDP-N-acetylmuramate--L-alanine ligase n=1 Tax=Robertkochia aurantiaca TaxID=2873700 RepID=UPI001CC9B21A|nr:UDP-N-acetylmuramate--L-alanine ligase [Robertkochia sp. 3YJGBD-33]